MNPFSVAKVSYMMLLGSEVSRTEMNYASAVDTRTVESQQHRFERLGSYKDQVDGDSGGFADKT